MWPWKSASSYPIVNVTFHQDHIMLAHISSKSSRNNLVTYQMINCDQLEIEKGILFNPTRIQHMLDDYLKQYRHPHAFFCFGLPGFYEEIIVTQSDESPKDELAQEELLLKWHYCSLGRVNNTHSAWYVCGIRPEILFQYQLLAIQLRINCILITTITRALIAAYQHVNANHSISHFHSLAEYTQEIINNYNFEQYNQLPNFLYQEHPIEMLSSIGLYILGTKSL